MLFLNFELILNSQRLHNCTVMHCCGEAVSDRLVHQHLVTGTGRQSSPCIQTSFTIMTTGQESPRNKTERKMYLYIYIYIKGI